MSYAFELHFDPDTEALIRAMWDQNTRLGYDTRLNGVAPHVTLAIASQVDEDLLSHLSAFAEDHPPFGVSFTGIESFPSGVQFLTPVESDELLAVHRDFHMRFPSMPASPNSHYYDPPRWTPHCTIATRIPEALIHTEMTFDDAERPSGTFTRLRVVEYPALKVHFDCPLGGGEGLS